MQWQPLSESCSRRRLCQNAVNIHTYIYPCYSPYPRLLSHFTSFKSLLTLQRLKHMAALIHPACSQKQVFVWCYKTVTSFHSSVFACVSCHTLSSLSSTQQEKQVSIEKQETRHRRHHRTYGEFRYLLLSGPLPSLRTLEHAKHPYDTGEAEADDGNQQH